MKPFSICGALGACSTLALVVGCGGAQLQTNPFGSISQSTVHSAQGVRALRVFSPDGVAKCPETDKAYTTGTSNGRVRADTLLTHIFGGLDRDFKNPFVYVDWPKNRPILAYKPQLLTCGPEASKKPFGEISQIRTRQISSSCDPKTSRCTYHYDVLFKYSALKNPPGAWRYDYVRIVPEKRTKGYGPLPDQLIEVFHH